MAIRYAVASGNWSSTATWNGGTLPAATDDVYANNFAVSIDQSVTVNSLKRIANGSPAITAGGSFTVTAAATVTITAGIASTDNTVNSQSVLFIDAGSAAVSLAGGTINGGAGTARVGCTVSAGHTGPVTVGNDVVGGASASTAYGLSVLGTGCTVTLNGAHTGGTSAVAVNIGGTNVIATINGASTGTSNRTAVEVNSSSAQVTAYGTLTGGLGTAAGLNVASGTARIDALLVYGPGAPLTAGIGAAIMFKRTGTNLAMRAPSDDNWPAATGANIDVERYTTGNPLPEDVREGTLYGPGDTSTGTLSVPPPSSVASGVPTDDTVGTAALALADVAALTGAQIAAATTA
jgi:hypothetical protein